MHLLDLLSALKVLSVQVYNGLAYQKSEYIMSNFLDRNACWYAICQTLANCERPVQGARKLTGENLKPVWAEFSTLS